MRESEIPLIGGRVTPGVVRVGATVRRPRGPQSAFVHQLLRGLAESGFAGAPQLLGIDDRDREILSFLPGDVPSDLGFFTAAQVGAAARLLRALHDMTAALGLRGASESFVTVIPAPAMPCSTMAFPMHGLTSTARTLDRAATILATPPGFGWISETTTGLPMFSSSDLRSSLRTMARRST